MTISKFFTSMSLSNDRFASMYARVSAASLDSPSRIRESRASTGVISSASPYQSRGVLLTGRSSSWPQAYLRYPSQACFSAAWANFARSAGSRGAAGRQTAQAAVAHAARRAGLKCLYCFVPMMLTVKPFETLHPAALPAPPEFKVDPFSVADAEWKVRTTDGQNEYWTAGQARLPDHEAELPLPCATMDPDPSRQMLENVASWPDTRTCTCPVNDCGCSPSNVSVAGPAHVPFIAVFSFPPEEPPHASTVAKITASPILMISPIAGGVNHRARGDFCPPAPPPSYGQGVQGTS